MRSNKPTVKWLRLMGIAMWLIVSMTIGVMVTVGVAWWCAWQSSQTPQPGLTVRYFGAGPRDAARIGIATGKVDLGLYFVQHCFGPTPLGEGMTDQLKAQLESEYRARIPWWATPVLLDFPPPQQSGSISPRLDEVAELGAGWPWVTMVGRITRQGQSPVQRIRMQDIMPVDNGPLIQETLLPTRPAWRGFVASTVIVAVVVMLLLALAVFVRRYRRYRRGACIACGYDMKGVPLVGGTVRTCPECGAQSRAKGTGAA